MHESRISGAELPRAISVRFAMVAFHTVMVYRRTSPEGSTTVRVVSSEVIFSIPAMKTSAAMATPRKDQQSSVRKTRVLAPVRAGPAMRRW